ncbi:MAG: formylmethanofuran--tetrahydromethanopterin N-formyltransferase [Methanobacteriota archaeon]|nr:MAG: formylmethanofuran--tetrahydromethanopterin N-formyltransferase [Euryarchaeota archaeon]
MKIDGADVEDTYAEAFDGLFCRLIVTAEDGKRLKQAVYSATALPSTVFGEAEGGVEAWLGADETPDGRRGAVIQLWVNHGREGPAVLEREVSKRIRQGILVVPTTRVFNALDSEDRLDIMDGVGHCGDGYETVERRFHREMINIPIMMGEFLIERSLGFSKGVMGGNIWIFCDSEAAALRAGDRAVEAVAGVSGAVTPFDVCSAGSKVETNFPEIGPTTNHPYCPSLRDRVADSMVPSGVVSIPEIVINGVSLDVVKKAMREVIYAVKDLKGVVKISAGNFGGKLGRHMIYLKDLLK